jgi:hypothetical protein
MYMLFNLNTFSWKAMQGLDVWSRENGSSHRLERCENAAFSQT